MPPRLTLYGVVNVLVVCTANICRSPTAARGLRVGLAEAGLAPESVEVESAGVAAADDLPMCEVADTLSAARLGSGGSHRSRPVTAEIAESADLILAADRGHRTAVGRLAPSTRARVFTLRQAARLAEWVTTDSGVLEFAAGRAAGAEPDLPEDDPRAQVPPLPEDREQRLVWLISEMDAARGMAPLDVDTGEPSDWHPEDIVDPHATDWQLHEAAVESCLNSTAAIVQAFRRVNSMP